MNKPNIALIKSKIESRYIYETLRNSVSMCKKCYFREYGEIKQCINNTLAVLIPGDFKIISGSFSEGTNIILQDYSIDVHSTSPCYVSDLDIMQVLCDLRVIVEGDTLPERFDKHMYCQAERGEHTTDGFRKLRIIHVPEDYLFRKFKAKYKALATIIIKSVKDGYMSSSNFLAATVSQTGYLPYKGQPIKTDLGTQGPSKMLVIGDFAVYTVQCFYVKTWPKEAESWFTRETHWPDKQLKSKIRKIGYLLVPIGKSQSQEGDLEWRCSFSMAEKILFQTMTNFQRCTFVILKVLLKENLSSNINTDGEKQLLSTYHMKTLFLWSLEDIKAKWKPEDMLNLIANMFEKLLCWLKQQYFPHYFIPTVNLIDSRWLHGREKALICCISAIKNDLSKKIMQSQFFTGQETNQINLRRPASSINVGKWIFYIIDIYQFLMKSITGTLQQEMLYYILENNGFNGFNSHLMLLESFIRIKHDIDPHLQHLYRAIFSDPFHDKLLTEVVPGLIDQYRGCIHLAKYCMAARDRCVLPGVLRTAESLLKDTLHLDPCSGYVKLACLYISTGKSVQAIDRLDIAESNFLFTQKNMETSAFRFSKWEGVDANTIPTEIFTFVIHEVFHKWAERQVTSLSVVTWPEYITAPDLLQFELIHESTQYVVCKIVMLDVHLQWPPLSMIKLLKFVCALNSGRSSITHMENLAADVIASSLSLSVFDDDNDIYSVFNMAAWCYVKINKYKPATRMMTVAIGTSSQTDMKRCAFSHHFLAYIIGQCML